MKISVTIITYNEEQNIKRAISSVESIADEIIVVDSLSADKTREVSADLGAIVYKQKFMGYGQQKNFAAEKSQYDWILNLDADEALSEKLINSIQALKTKNSLSYSAFSMARLNHYCGNPIQNGGWYPDRNVRFYNKKYCEWSKPNVHEELLVKTGGLGHLNGDLLHFPFKDIKSQVLKNISYAELGAKDLLRKKGGRPNLFELLIRPLWKFIECYLLKKGCLDGISGFIIAVNAAYSMFLKYSIAYFED